MKFIALPYCVGQNEPSVPLRDLVDTPEDYRKIAFENAFRMVFDYDGEDVKVKIKKGGFGDYYAHDEYDSNFMYFTEVLGH